MDHIECIGQMSPIADTQKFDKHNCNDPLTCLNPATVKAVAEFVVGHKETLDYNARFGSPIQRAEAILFLRIAQGSV